MKKIKKTKIGLGLIGCMMTLSLTSALAVSASDSDIHQRLNQSLIIDGPYFYELDNNDIKTSYKYESDKDSLIRYQKELTEFRLGQSLRTKVNVENKSSSNQKMKLITVLEDLKGQQDDILKMSDISEIKAHENQEVYVDVKIPDSGDYRFKVYIWDDLNGMKALKDTIILADGASNLSYEYDGAYNRDNPRIVLNWKGNAKVDSYDIYVENEVIANVKGTSYHLDLEPYTPYKISVQARLKDGKLTAHSNTLYFMTEDTVASQESRMNEWEDDRFGMMITFGGFSAFGGEYKGLNVNGEKIDYDSAGGGNGAYSEWIKFGAGIPDDIYKQTVEEKFTAENYNPKEWVQIAKNAGMKYIVLITKHHEGMTLFNTAAKNGWSIEDTKGKLMVENLEQKDFFKQLIYEGAKEGIKVGAYYSQTIDWAQPGSIGWTPQRQSQWSQDEIEKLKKDIVASGVSQDIVDKKIWDILGGAEYEDMVKMNEEVILTQVEELMTMKVNVNGKDVGIDTLWWDMGQGEYPEFNYEIMKKVVELDPDKKIKMNNRILHQENYTTMPFDYVTPEQSIPSAPDSKYWETCMTMNTNWGYAKNDHDWKSAQELVHNLSRIVSMNGNFLLNVGPKPDASFPQESKDLLAQVGEWMKINGEAIYQTSKSPFLNELPYGYATQKGNKVYLHVYDKNSLNQIIIPGLKTQPENIKVITGENTYQNVSFLQNDDYKGYQLTDKVNPTNEIATVIVLEFNQSPEFEKCDKAFPVIQDNQTHHALFKPNGSTIVFDKDADMNNDLQVENGENFGRWNHEGSYAKWDFVADKAGLYSIKTQYASPLKGVIYVQLKDKDGNIVDEARTQYGPSSDKDGWVVYKELTLGSLQIPASGEYTVELHRTITDAPADAVDAGPVNIKTTELIPLNEYGLTSQDIHQSIFNQNGLRNSASGFVGSVDSYNLKGPLAHIDWYVDIYDSQEKTPSLTLATGGQNAKIQILLLDDRGQVISDQSIYQVVQTKTWEFENILLENKLDLSGLEGTYSLQLRVLEGTVNFKQINFLDNKEIILNINDNIIIDDQNASQTITSNIPVSYVMNNPSLIEIEEISKTEYKITPKPKQEGEVTLTLLSIDNPQNKKDIHITILDGSIDIPKSYKLESQNTPTQFSTLKIEGDEKRLEQEIQNAVKTNGKGIYKLEFIYNTPVNTKYAYQQVSDWKEGDLQIDGWYKTHVYVDLRQYEDGTLLIKPFNNFNGITVDHEIKVASVSFKKLDDSTEMIGNSTLSSEYIDRLDEWNRNQLSCSLNIQLKAYHAILHNKNTETNANIVIESSNDEYMEYGQLGNWWDPLDQFSWALKIKEDGSYKVNAKVERLFNDCPIHIVIKNQNSEEVYNDSFIAVSGQKSYTLVENLDLKKGEYTVEVDRIGTNGDQVPNFFGIDVKENKASPLTFSKVIALVDKMRNLNG